MRNARTWDEEDEEYPETLSGEKKRLASPMTKRYHLWAVEKSWYKRYPSHRPCSNCCNQGHLVRWQRMSGYNIVRVPGMDHAGIAMQVVVEKKLMRQKQLTRHDNSREESWPRFGNGRKSTGERFYSSCAVWGLCGCFTMDEKRSNVMTEVFLRLHNAKTEVFVEAS
ncbi:hypothetical protein ACFX13_015171 [Malus domestica]